jgi:hypothetical protein
MVAKRKLDPALYNVNLPVPKWPRADQPELWSKHDGDSAVMVNSLSLDAPKASPNPLVHYGPFSQWIKVSPFLQSLDLASFDDFDIELDDDLEKVRRRQLELHKAEYSSVWILHIQQNF